MSRRRGPPQSEGATSETSDANGNVTSRSGTASYTWDIEQRLVRIVLADGRVVEHTYDPDGHRVATRVTPTSGSAQTNDFLVDTTSALSQVVAERSAGTLSALYVRAGDGLLAVLRPTGGQGWVTRFVHSDAVGSVRALTDETGSVMLRRSYEAFGRTSFQSGTDPLVYGFAGEAWEKESGLGDHRARWLELGSGRFLGEDPLARCSGCEVQPGSLYTYAGNSPVMKVDPSGNIEASAVSAIGVALMATLSVGCNAASTVFVLPRAGADIKNMRAWLAVHDGVVATMVRGNLINKETGSYDFGGSRDVLFSGRAIDDPLLNVLIAPELAMYDGHADGSESKQEFVRISVDIVSGCNSNDPDKCKKLGRILLGELQHTYSERRSLQRENGVNESTALGTLYPMLDYQPGLESLYHQVLGASVFGDDPALKHGLSN